MVCCVVYRSCSGVQVMYSGVLCGVQVMYSVVLCGVQVM